VGVCAGSTAMAGQFTGGEVEFFDVGSAAKHKSYIGRTVRLDGTEFNSGYWQPAADAAITALTFSLSSGNFVANSTIALYGIS
jgi:hypothetical protein